MSLDRREIVSLVIPATLATVWEHLRNPVLARRWFGWDRPGLDEDIHTHLIGEPTESRSVDRDSTIHTLTWPHHDQVTVSGAAHEPGVTRIVVTRQSHEGLLGAYDGVRDEVDENWLTYAHQLHFALTVRPDEDRQTLAVFDLDAGDRRSRLLDRAGLHGVRGIPVGAHVQARRPDGTLLGGTVAYKAEHQFGIHLHGVTEAFLVIRETPIASHPPHGTVGAILSTYGLDPVTFDEVHARWSGWWKRSGAAVPA